MNILPRQSLVLLVCSPVVACILLSLLVASPVRADVGVQPILPDGSSLEPEDETPVIMQAETVTLNVREATETDNTAIKLNPEAYGYQFEPIWFPAIAEVQADFTMKNPTSEEESMTVWFPLASALERAEWDLNLDEIVPRIGAFRVTVDGKAVDHSVSELPNPRGEDKPPLPWASFLVAFPAGEEVLIQVSYLLPAKGVFPDREEVLLQETSVLPTELFMNWYVGVGMIFNYIFQTGAGWAGPIGKAELVVNLPYPASAETILAMPDGGQARGQQVRWTWENLEPGSQDDFSIWLITMERWEELQAARANVEAKPSDGHAWLNLCGAYHTLSFAVGGHAIPGFGETYPPLAVQACQEAARLLPGDAAPHNELAMLYLSTLPENPPPEALQPVRDELKIGQELEAAQPPSEVSFAWNPFGDYTSMSEYITVMLEGIVNDATATAESVARSTDWAKETADQASMQTLSATLTPELSQPSPTFAPPAPPLIPPEAETSSGPCTTLIVAAGAIGLVIVGYQVLNRMRGKAGKAS